MNTRMGIQNLEEYAGLDQTDDLVSFSHAIALAYRVRDLPKLWS
jgi:hypothetical protein